jgi:hypothetical protein
VPAVAGMTRNLSAPTPQTFAGSNYNFVVWSDGGAVNHSITVQTNTMNLTASYVPPLLSISNAPGMSILQWPAWAAPFSVWWTTNLESPVWAKIADVPSSDADNFIIPMPNTNGSMFYRLQFP